jgi:hypothetical protein
MRWVLLFLLVMPAWGQPAVHQVLDDLIAVSRAASDLLQGIAADSRALIRDYRRPDPFSYQPAVKGLSFQSLELKGRVARLKEPQPLLVEAAAQAEAGTEELQRCLDQLSVLADRPEDEEQRLRLLATLQRTHEMLGRLVGTLDRASRSLNGRPASPPAQTPPQ